ncbi:M48 family metallopeptidase [Sphingomonas sp.]|uniref:M48 family metallopeptidase n=1 Tax=Sphingomonas sp. TaxID=28214 RepID=UPI002ED883C6
MMRAFRNSAWCAAWLAALAPAPQAVAQSGDSTGWEMLRRADLQLASIGFRLSVAAAPLCDRLEPGLGIQFHTLAQYMPDARTQVRAHFRFSGPVAVEGVVPDSPAARAGIEADDTVTAINGVPIADEPNGPASTARLAGLHAQLARLPPATPIELTLNRSGRELRRRVVPLPACFSRYELRIDDDFDARANGELVQVTSKYLEAVDANLLPAVIAHELSHNILQHRARLSAAGAQFGIASGLGRNLGLFRQTEIEADILAVHLLARAGYSPALAARFWLEAGPKLLAGKMRSRSHPPLRDRVAIAAAEAARFEGAAAVPPPAFVAARNTALNGNWQQYLKPVRAREKQERSPPEN